MAAMMAAKNSLFKRDSSVCCDEFDNCYYCNSTWDNWVRWLVLAIIIIAAFLIFFAFSCISARRRRRMGNQPFRGTGWALGRTPPGHAPATYNAQPYYNNSNNPAPPPAYTPAPNQQYGSYYRPQQEVELQQPPQAYGGYRGGDEPVYEPPKDAPPGRL